MAKKQDLTHETLEAAKQLAPWSTSLPWWVVLIEGIILGGIGLLVLLNPTRANINVVLILSAGLALAGILQVWDVLRGKAPESVDSAVSARAGIAVYAGFLILILYFIEEITVRGGLLIFGLASLIYGFLGLALIFNTIGAQRRQAIVEFVLFTGAGLLIMYTLVSGPSAVTTAATIAGWLALLSGIALIGLSIWRMQKGDQADELINTATNMVNDATDTVTSIGKPSSTTADAPMPPKTPDTDQASE
jgi:uncharacterized membrane protein HdeD (DUF308 family)